MPGTVQMLEGLEDVDEIDALMFQNGVDSREYVGDLGDLGGEPPAFVGALVKGLVNDPQIHSYLYSLGRYTAKKGLGELKEALFGKPKPSSPWMAATFDPILEPFIDGVLSVLREKATPYLIGVGALSALAAFGLGALIFRTGKKHCPPCTTAAAP